MPVAPGSVSAVTYAARALDLADEEAEYLSSLALKAGLEAELGVRLFFRVAKDRVAPTPHGRALLGVAGGALPEGAAREVLLSAGRQMPSYDGRRPWTPAEVDRQVHPYWCCSATRLVRPQ